VVFSAIDFLGSGVDCVQFKLLQQSSSEQEAGAVGGSVVGETNFDAISWQLTGVGVANANITLNTSICDLACHVLVGESNNKSVFWSVVFALVLENQALSCIVVSLSL